MKWLSKVFGLAALALGLVLSQAPAVAPAKSMACCGKSCPASSSSVASSCCRVAPAPSPALAPSAPVFVGIAAAPVFVFSGKVARLAPADSILGPPGGAVFAPSGRSPPSHLG